MASPQLENGYTRIANELLEAICRLKISGNEMRILLFIIRQTYGYSRKSAKISLSEISKAVGMTSDNVSKTLKNCPPKTLSKSRKTAVLSRKPYLSTKIMNSGEVLSIPTIVKMHNRQNQQ